MRVKEETGSGGEPGSAVGLTTATARMLLAPLEGSGGRAEQIARRLGTAIRLGLLIDGERLPSESQLATQLGISTVTLREALSSLREQGLVVTRRGRNGGTFVRSPADPGEPILEFGLHDLQDLGDQRRAIAGAAARLAAERARPQEIDRIAERVARLEAAQSPSERRRADTQLAIEVAAAAQSPRLAREEARLRAETGDLLTLAIDYPDHGAVVRVRWQLVEALRERDPALARERAELQVAAETERLIDLRLRALQPQGSDASDGDPLADLITELDQVLAELHELSERFAAIVSGARQARADDLQPLRPAIFAILHQHPDLITGAGVITAPDLLDDAPLWLEWWSTASDAGPEPLRVNLDPAAPDFFDYPMANWYTAPNETRETQMTGPVVDYACTNRYAITLSVPTPGPAGLVGIAAADVLVASIERRVLPRLVALSRPVALVNEEGRVITSNDPSCSPGRLLEPDPVPAAPTSSRAARSLRLIDL